MLRWSTTPQEEKDGEFQRALRTKNLIGQRGGIRRCGRNGWKPREGGACDALIIKAMEVLGKQLERFGLSLHPDKPPGEIVGARPHTFGWLRRSEFDDLAGGWYFEAWERPDGGIVKIPRPDGRPVTTIIAVHGRSSPAVVVWPRGTVQI
jgi:hypothetical protein